MSESSQNIKIALEFFRDFFTLYKNFLTELEGLNKEYGVNFSNMAVRISNLVGKPDDKILAELDPKVLSSIFKFSNFIRNAQDIFDIANTQGYEPAINKLSSITEILEENIGASKLLMTPTDVDKDLIKRCIGKDYHDILTNAFPILEDRIRKKIVDYDANLQKQLVDIAFNPDNGKIAIGNSKAEKEGIFFLYKGAFGFLRNPPHHSMDRTRSLNDAIKIIYFVDLLLKLLNDSKLQTGTHVEE